ncbi:hypothetical protein QFC20_002250 [Naganishia adeliensis]|uniref:Uncharacterized protein n=1 Tax=Naganishia adeliensis TaxID=92952 RepID=A0ACC2WLF4_9TREE|nr:hypothetical protein QFC20_002250 [Naganishia adeliensis]
MLYNVDWSKPFPAPINEGLIRPLVETGLKLITVGGAGYDRVDIDYLTANGVLYANNPRTVMHRTADSTAMMILMACKGATQQERSLREGKWANRALKGKNPRGLTLGIVGMGNIGAIVAENMTQFGMKILYTKRKRLSSKEEKDYTYVTLDELLERSDVISLMCPLTPETHHLIGAAEFDKMKQDVILVNTARGAVVDENAMVDALNSGKVLRVALDVFENEPHVHPGLLSHPGTTLLPHAAVLDDTLMLENVDEMFANVEAFARTGTPNTPVNAV